MKWIKRLEIRNALGIKEFELSPGKITLIQGENESGKSSILEDIEKALYNRNRRTDFVRKGEKEAILYVELDDGTKIDKKVLADGEVRGKVIRDGVSIPKPETFLKSLVGEYSFNPVDFLMRTDKEQTQILLSLIPMRITEEMLKKWTGEVPPVDLDNHAIQVLGYLAERYYYDKRTTANAELKDIRDQIDSLRAELPDNYDPKEWKDVELYALHEKVRSAQDHNKKIDEAKLYVEEFESKQKDVNRKYDLLKKERIEEDAERITEIKEEIARLKEEMAGIEGKQSEAIKEIEKDRKTELENREQMLAEKVEFVKNVKIQPVDDLLAEAKKTEEMKGYLNMANKLNELIKNEVASGKEAIRLDKLVDALRKKPAELLAGVKLPVKGMGINEKMQIIIDDLPIDNLSTQRKIELSVDIARATAGELGLICVDRFETFDAENQKIFFNEIGKDKFQYFITEVVDGPLKITSIK